mmetsp:Transcript_36103/g.116765  ORF Transcript_36103/g.116765 Transcript_36103/m.116765 type:complete len:314 (+) Transcript_36103:1399-2340(+)
MFGCFKPLQMSSSTLSFSRAFSPALPVSLATACFTAKIPPVWLSWARTTEPYEPEPMTAPFLQLPIGCVGSSSLQPFLCPGALQELGCRPRLPKSVGSGAARTSASHLVVRILLVSVSGVAAGSRASASCGERSLTGVGEALASLQEATVDVSERLGDMRPSSVCGAFGGPGRHCAATVARGDTAGSCGDDIGKGFEWKRLFRAALDSSDTAEPVMAPAERLRLSTLRAWRSSSQSGVEGEHAAWADQQAASMKTSGVLHSGNLFVRLDETRFSPGEPPSANKGWSLKLGGGSKRKLAPWTSHPACRTPPVRD